jgi:hypothetical protein
MFVIVFSGMLFKCRRGCRLFDPAVCDFPRISNNCGWKTNFCDRPDDGGSKHLRNVCLLVWYYTVPYPRRLSPSYSYAFKCVLNFPRFCIWFCRHIVRVLVKKHLSAIILFLWGTDEFWIVIGMLRLMASICKVNDLVLATIFYGMLD